MAGLYIHVPFCHSKCIYCDFYSIGRRAGTPRDLSEQFVDTVEAELRSRRHEIDGDFTTVYIGGGTPSSLHPVSLRRLLGIALDAAPGQVEFTVEVNPEDVDDNLCHLLTAGGVNRVSMGIQTFDDTILGTLGRRHSAGQAEEAIARLRSAGITNISGDLIFGLPGDTPAGWEKSVDRFISLGLPHLSAYLLSYEPGTRLTLLRDMGKIAETSESDIDTMYSLLTSKAREAGYLHYEISNYSLEGMMSRHNSSYWDGTPYLGLGPGAHSFDGSVRRYNPSSLKDYIASGGEGFAVAEERSATDVANDIILTAMRTARGLSLDPSVSALAPDVLEAVKKSAQPHLKAGRLAITDSGRLVIPEQHLLISDSIIVDLIL